MADMIPISIDRATGKGRPFQAGDTLVDASGTVIASGGGGGGGPWTSFTPTGSWTTNVTYYGVYRQSGDHLEILTSINFAGAPDATKLTLNPPPGFTINTSLLELTPVNNDFVPLGSCIIHDAGTIILHGGICWTLGAITPFKLVASTATLSGNPTSGNEYLTNLIPMTWASGDQLYLRYSIPVNEANAGSQLAVAFGQSELNPAQSIPNNVDTVLTNWSTITTPAASKIVMGSDRATAQVAGIYRVSAKAYFASGAGSARALSIWRYNSSDVQQDNGYATEGPLSGLSTVVGTSWSFTAAAGDYFKIHVYQNSGGALNVQALTPSLFQIEYLGAVDAGAITTPSWQSYTPTGTWTTNTTYNGRYLLTPTAQGYMMDLRVFVNLSGAPNATSLLNITMPSGWRFDYGSLGLVAGEVEWVGNVACRNPGSAVHIAGAVSLEVDSPTIISPRAISSTTGAGALITQASPFTFGIGDSVHLAVIFPVVAV